MCGFCDEYFAAEKRFGERNAYLCYENVPVGGVEDAMAISVRIADEKLVVALAVGCEYPVEKEVPVNFCPFCGAAFKPEEGYL